MRPPEVRAMFEDELVIDCFAGGGGASLGIEWAIGRSPDVAVNHDPEAIAMHVANHPKTRHLLTDVREVSPRSVCGGRRVAFAWFSPDCTFFSKSRGAKPFRDRNAARRRRGLANVVITWAREVKPRVIFLENVEEFQDWGPLDLDGRPIPDKAGLSFRVWLGKLKAQGYEVEMRELRACDYGAPTSRKRLFIIARRDGLPIVWPEPTHGPGRSMPHRAAAECIQWEHPTRSIFGRERPLADNTLARIARGVQRFVIEAAEPFIVPVSHSGDTRVHGIHEPIRTITASSRAPFALVGATLIHSGNGERPGQAPRCYDLRRPLGTVMAQGQKHALIAAALVKHYGGHEGPGQALTAPLSTITTQDHHALVAVEGGGQRVPEVLAFLTKYYGTSTGQPLQLPLGTVTTRDRFGLVTVAGDRFAIADIGHRMLRPRELFRGQGFPDTYRIDDVVAEVVTKTGKRARRLLTQTAQIHMCGNSVPPWMSYALVRANVVTHREVVAA